MIREILTYPKDKETLTLKSLEVQDVFSKEIKDTIQDLKDTLNSQSRGVGISAIQIGIPLRICVIHYGKEVVMINPEITWKRSGLNGLKKIREGCLSAPNTFIEVERPQKVICEYTDEEGNRKEIAEGGLMSAIIQHELDHFDGYCHVFDAVEDDKI